MATPLGLLLAACLTTTALATTPGPNGLIAFIADTGNGYQVYTISPNGTDQRRLTDLPGDALQPHWSPQSNRIVFEFDPANVVNNDYCHVASINRNGTGLKIFPLAKGDQCEATPTFSADGRTIYYEGFDGDSRDAIFRMDRNGRHRQFISACLGQGVTDPEVSPDGTMLSFACNLDDGRALFVSRVDGSDLRQVTPFSLEVGTKSDWSPDSRRIMFISLANDEVNTATIAPDGADLTWVTNYPAGGDRAYGNTYSPDGQWILLRVERGDQFAMFTVHPDGTGLTQVTDFSDFRPRGMAWGRALANVE